MRFVLAVRLMLVEVSFAMKMEFKLECHVNMKYLWPSVKSKSREISQCWWRWWRIFFSFIFFTNKSFHLLIIISWNQIYFLYLTTEKLLTWTLEARCYISLIIIGSPFVSFRTDWLHLLRCPSVQINRFHFWNMDAQTSMNTRAANTYKDSLKFSLRGQKHVGG